MNCQPWTFVMVVALFLGASCNGDPTHDSPPAGTLIVRLTTPHADDGAMTFELNGPPIDSAVAIDTSLRLFTRRESGTTIVGALVGSLAGGAVVRLYGPGLDAAGYTARVLDVADRQDELRESLAGYALMVGANNTTHGYP